MQPARADEPVPQRRPKPTSARGRRSREALIAAARTVFERNGFYESRITDITRAAGVAHGTFYTHFESKQEIFITVLQQATSELLGVRKGVREAGNDPIKRIRSANSDYLRAYVDNRGVMIAWEQQRVNDKKLGDLATQSKRRFVERTVRAIVRLQASGQADPKLDAFYAAYALTGMVSRFAYLWVLDDLPFEYDTAADQLTRLWANALGLRQSS